MSNPYISVLILAHDRRKYLFDAINSVLSQDFPRDRYEVLIVKYELDNDKENDKKLEELGVRVINTKEVSLGAKILVGAEEAKGEVLTFLEDDDLFLPRKLSRVYEVFRKDKKIGYYHNEMIFFDINKNEEIKSETEARKKLLLKFKKYFINDLMIEGVNFWSKIPIISMLFFGFNNSSISVKKDVILSFSKVYKYSESNHAIDFLHFLLSLELGYLTVMDRKELTLYRVHSISTMMKKLKTFEDYVKYETDIAEVQLRNLSLPFQLYKLNSAEKLLTTFQCYIELLKYSYEDTIGMKINSHVLPIINCLIRNDTSYIYLPRLLLSYVFTFLPSRLKRMVLRHIFKKYSKPA